MSLFFAFIIFTVAVVYISNISLKYDSKQNSSIMDVAVLYLEQGYALLKNSDFDFPIIGLYMHGDTEKEFKVAIYLTGDDKRFAEFILRTEGDNGWHISSDGCYLQKTSLLSYKGSWEFFKRDILKAVKDKHPDWQFNKNDELVVK